MGALVERELKPKHKRTMGINEAGIEIEDPEEFCLTFGEDEEYFDKVKAMLEPSPYRKEARRSIKMVLVGDTSVGKSCLITNYLHNSFSEDYEPTVLDIYRGTKNVNRQQIEIEIHDTSGDMHFGSERKVQY